MERATAPPALQLILQSLASSTADSDILLLDNACGAGIVTKFLFEMELGGRGMEVVAGDYEAKMVELMQARVVQNGLNAKAMIVDAGVRHYSSLRYDSKG